MNLSGRGLYQDLWDMAEQDRRNGREQQLNLNIHRYKAMTGNLCRGFYSTLEQATRNVDESAPGNRTWPWGQVAEPESGNYVVDLVGGAIYARSEVAEVVPEPSGDALAAAG